ncbi:MULTISPECIES: hypothetical protein [Burkholderia]|uniref:hypothetical protein n=1 Tax=Burkholderia TaxID=32008 RepID=UPI00163DFE48|nr:MULTISPECIES: hypothetical protein [Burkholderia]
MSLYRPVCSRCGCTLNVAPCLRCSLNDCRHVNDPIPAGPVIREPMVSAADLIGLAGLLLVAVAVAVSGAALWPGLA